MNILYRMNRAEDMISASLRLFTKVSYCERSDDSCQTNPRQLNNIWEGGILIATKC